MHRTDLTAKALKAEAIRLGARYMAHDGTIDCNLWLPDGRVLIVDWKTPGADLTPSQSKLVAAGWPIRFVSTPEQLHRLLAESPAVAR
jgi:hypothetical protein